MFNIQVQRLETIIIFNFIIDQKVINSITYPTFILIIIKINTKRNNCVYLTVITYDNFKIK